MRKIQITPKDLSWFAEDLRAAPDDHLTGEEVVERAVGELSADRTEVDEHHLKTCGDCRAEVEWLVQASAVWSGELGIKRLVALRDRVERAVRKRPV